MEQRLKELFESDNFLGQGISKFRKYAKDNIPEVTNAEIKEFYEKNTLRQIMAPIKTKRTFNPIVTLKHNHVLYLDTLFMKQDGIAVIVAMCLFSKKSYALVVKLKKKTTKKDGSIIPGTSVKAEDGLRFLQSILRNDKYIEVRVDGGVEWGDSFKEYVTNTPNLTLKVLISQEKRLMSPIERYVRTFRSLYGRKKELKKGRVYADRQKFVDEIIDTYNNTVHSTLKPFTPNEVYTDQKDSRRIMIEKYRERIRNAVVEEELPIGTKVRIFSNKRIAGRDSIFVKSGSQNWSKKIYTVNDDTFNRELKRYRFNNKLFSRDYLQVVPEGSENKEDPVTRPRGRPRIRRTNRRRNPRQIMDV